MVHFYEPLWIPELLTAHSLRAVGTPGISYHAQSCRYFEIERHRRCKGRPTERPARIPGGIAFLNLVGTGNRIASHAQHDRTCRLLQLTWPIRRPTRVLDLAMISSRYLVQYCYNMRVRVYLWNCNSFGNICYPKTLLYMLDFMLEKLFSFFITGAIWSTCRDHI